MGEDMYEGEGIYEDEGMYEGEGIYEDEGMYEVEGMLEVKDPLMSSWLFVGGITAPILAISIVLGIFLAKIKIKKGIDLYED